MFEQQSMIAVLMSNLLLSESVNKQTCRAPLWYRKLSLTCSCVGDGYLPNVLTIRRKPRRVYSVSLVRPSQDHLLVSCTSTVSSRKTSTDCYPCPRHPRPPLNHSAHQHLYHPSTNWCLSIHPSDIIPAPHASCVHDGAITPAPHRTEEEEAPGAGHMHWSDCGRHAQEGAQELEARGYV